MASVIAEIRVNPGWFPNWRLEVMHCCAYRLAKWLRPFPCPMPSKVMRWPPAANLRNLSWWWGLYKIKEGINLLDLPPPLTTPFPPPRKLLTKSKHWRGAGLSFPWLFSSSHRGGKCKFPFGEGLRVRRRFYVWVRIMSNGDFNHHFPFHSDNKLLLLPLFSPFHSHCLKWDCEKISLALIFSI